MTISGRIANALMNYFFGQPKGKEKPMANVKKKAAKKAKAKKARK